MLHNLPRCFGQVACGVAWLFWSAGFEEVRASEKYSLPEFLARGWSGEDGLPAAPVQSIARTPDGFLWVATDRGLAQFDGVRFVIFTTNNLPALGDDRISALFVDEGGNLWIGTHGGTLARRQAGRIASVSLDQDCRGFQINAMAQDADGALWLATLGGGLIRVGHRGCERVGSTNGMPGATVTQLVADKQRKLWAIAEQKLITWEAGRWQPPKDVPFLEGDPVALARSADGGLWVGTTFPQLLTGRGGQVFKLKDGGWEKELTPYLWAQDTVFARITTLIEDREGRLWAGTPGAGMFYWETGANWRKLAPEGTLAQLDCACIALDGEDALWAGSTLGELVQLRHRLVTTLHLPAVAEKNILRNACAAHDGSVWVGTDGAGAFRHRDGRFTRFGEGEGLANGHIGVILEDSKTNLWVGTWNGLFRWRGDRFERVPGPPPLSQVVLTLCEDRDGSMWAGTSAGVVRWGTNGAKVYGHAEGVDHFYIRGITQDTQGRIWLAIMDAGLYLLQDGRFTRYGKGHWPGETLIRSLHADAEGGLWIATFGAGLTRLKDGRFTSWTMRDGLPSDTLVAITEDQEGNLWFSSEDGIFGSPRARIEAYQPGVNPQLLFWHLSVAEGLEAKKCGGAGQPVIGRSTDGRLWVPNWRALAVFDPSLLPNQWSMWPVVMEEVLVDGKSHDSGQGREVRVSSSVRSYEIRYTSPNLRAPERVRFRYRLKGYDSGWVEADQRRAAYYSRLLPGEYDFQVMAGSPAGAWQESAESLRLVVVPQPWERPTVRVAGAGALVALVAGAVWRFERNRTRRRLQLAAAQQAMERERRRIARDLHDDLGSDLTEIMLLGERASQPTAPVEAVRAQAGAIAVRSRQASAAMDEIVWTVNPRNDSVPRLADRVVERARRLFESQPVQLRVEIMEDIPILPLPAVARHNLYLTAKEAQNNVAKHSGATEVKVAVWCECQRLVVSVEDNGKGFDPASQSGSRNGLENMRQRMEAIGGTLTIASQPGRGTTVRLEYPLPNAA